MWLTTEAISDAIRAGKTRVIEDGCDCYCLSTDNRYAVLVREHAAWTGSDPECETWYSGNYSPKDGATGRRLINIFKMISPDGPGLWYKFFVPTDVVIMALYVLTDDTSQFAVETECASYVVQFGKLDAFMWDAMTGHAETEDDIRKTFGRFVGL